MGFDVHLFPTRAGEPREVFNPFTKERVMTTPLEMSDEERARAIDAFARHGGNLDASGSGVLKIAREATLDVTALGMVTVRGSLDAACVVLFDVADGASLVVAGDTGPSVVTRADMQARVRALCEADPALGEIMGDEVEVAATAKELADLLRDGFDRAIAYSRHAMDAEE